MNVHGKACPTIQKCNISAKKCGLLVSGHSKSKLEECTMSGCGGQACRAMEHAKVQMIRWASTLPCDLLLCFCVSMYVRTYGRIDASFYFAFIHECKLSPRLHVVNNVRSDEPSCVCRCVMEKNEEECIVGMGASNIDLHACCLNSSQGPAVDLSQTAKLYMSQGSVLDCVGELCCLPDK